MNLPVDPRIVEATYVAGRAEQEALNGVPVWYEIPDELRQVIEKATISKERMFWLRSQNIEKNSATSALLRRAIYAEQRCWEMENRAAEMALITSGAAARVKELEALLAKAVEATT